MPAFRDFVSLNVLVRQSALTLNLHLLHMGCNSMLGVFNVVAEPAVTKGLIGVLEHMNSSLSSSQNSSKPMQSHVILLKVV